MKSLLLLLATSFIVAGCGDLNNVDTIAPAAPRGIRTISLDHAVALSWLANTEQDVAGYKIWWSDHYDGRYTLLGSTSGTTFTDYEAVNGVKVYYALSAYDHAKNESDLSKDVVYDTPRPEGYDVILNDYHAQPSTGGYDFSTYSVGPYDDQFTDVFFESFGGEYSLVVWSDTDIQDMGYTGSLDEISTAPTIGWAPSRRVEAIPGHTYVLWTWDDHYAKVRVKEASGLRVVFDWAYQTAATNTELRSARPVTRHRAPLQRTEPQ